MPPIPIFVALADPTRCRIIELLRNSPQPVHLLAAEFAISRPAISRHLRVLKEARLISERKVGRENLYSLHPKRLAPAGEWIGGMLANSKPAPASPPKKRSAQIKAKVGGSASGLSQMGFEF